MAFVMRDFPRNRTERPEVKPGWGGWRWVAVLGALCLGCGGDARPPNLLLLVSDDQDYEHFGFMGHPLAHTPTLDRLAERGVLFDHAYVPMSRCRPAQAALLSGRWPHQNGVYYNVGGDHIDPDTCIANLLGREGYACFGEGKFWEFDPRKMGFLNDKILNYDTFARRGQEHLFAFLRERDRERPFFVWWAPELPHVPHDPPRRLLELIDRDAIEVPDWYGGDVEAFRTREHLSLAMGAWLDEAVGELLAELERLGELEDTLILFLVDNGYANGLPSKGTAFEKGLRTPAIFAWGDRWRGERFDDLVPVVDLHATLLDYAGARQAPDAPGISLRPRLEGRPFTPRAALYGAIYTQAPTEPDARPERDAFGLWAVDHRWKYVLYLDDVREAEDQVFHIQANLCPYPERDRGDEDLFDLQADPYELRNLSGDPDQRARMDAMRAEALDWWRASGGKPLDLP